MKFVEFNTAIFGREWDERCHTVQVGGAVCGIGAHEIRFDSLDFHRLMQMEPQQLKDYLQSLQCRFYVAGGPKSANRVEI